MNALPPAASPSPRRRGAWLTGTLWVIFLSWSVAVAFFWTSGFGETEVLAWTQRLFHLPPPETDTPHPLGQAAILWALTWLDPVWIILAATLTYLSTQAQEGLGTARRWAGVTLLAAGLLAGLSAHTGWPLGHVLYTGLLGSRLWLVPLGLPLLWLSVFLGARDLALRLRPSLAPRGLALSTGGLLGLFDFLLEPVAWKVRVFWLWYPGELPTPSGPPLQNLLTWIAFGAVLGYNLREGEVARSPLPWRRSPAAIFLLLAGGVILAGGGLLVRG